MAVFFTVLAVQGGPPGLGGLLVQTLPVAADSPSGRDSENIFKIILLCFAIFRVVLGWEQGSKKLEGSDPAPGGGCAARGETLGRISPTTPVGLGWKMDNVRIDDGL
jgi:hypothetical protein